MSALSRKLRDGAGGMVQFWCPGCGLAHAIRVSGERQPVWAWNGDAERPTFQPSVLVRWERRSGAVVCHSFVTDGRIQFLTDCTHDLAGKTVDLPDFPGVGDAA